MANAQRGEISAMFEGEERVLCLTLGALAELEARLQAGDLVGLPVLGPDALLVDDGDYALLGEKVFVAAYQIHRLFERHDVRAPAVLHRRVILDRYGADSPNRLERCAPFEIGLVFGYFAEDMVAHPATSHG